MCIHISCITHARVFNCLYFFSSSSWEQGFQSVQTALVQVWVLIVLREVVQSLHSVKKAYTQEPMLLEELQGKAHGGN